MGAYHGEAGFRTFNHERGVHSRSTRLDPALMYPPYTKRKEALLRRGMTMADPRDTLARLRNAFRSRG